MSSYDQNEFHFSIGHERITWGVRLLILACVAVFAGQLVLYIFFDPIVITDPVAFSPDRFMHGWVWMPFTYMFLHSGLAHLFFNMLMLYFFGPDVERFLGTRQFACFYLACGALGVLAKYFPIVFLDAPSDTAVLGASGACSGVLVAFAMIHPDRKVFLFPMPFPINVRAIVLILIVFNLLSALGAHSSMSVATHFGGMLVGFLFMKLWPRMSQWRFRWRISRKGPSKKDLDKMGEDIDNIFRFDDGDRR